MISNANYSRSFRASLLPSCESAFMAASKASPIAFNEIGS